MEPYYDKVYNRRLNRFGENPQERIIGQRMQDFLDMKARSIYRIAFLVDEDIHEGVFYPKKRDETKTQYWLLTELRDKFDGGTLFSYNGKQWMIVYQDNDETTGYNKYCAILMTHTITWEKEGVTYSSPGYFYGPMADFITDTSRVQSRSTGPYAPDPSKRTHIIMPKNLNLRRQDYIFIDGEGYFVSGYDYNSTPGVEYFSLIQTQVRTPQTPPEIPDEDPVFNPEEFFFFNGGKK